MLMQLSSSLIPAKKILGRKLAPGKTIWQKNQPNVVLCVATEPADNIDEYLDWCAEHQVEFVDGNLNQGQDPREKVGLQRVLEALESNLWENMQREPQAKRVIPVVETQNNYDTLSTPAPTDGPEVQAPPQKAATQETKPTVAEPAQKVAVKPEQKPEIPLDQLGLGWMKGINNDDFDIERAIHEFGALKSKAASLPDDQRRAMAANVALAFAAMLGSDSEED